MLFNSISFAYFLPIVFILYWFVFNKNRSRQNIILLAASYYFYSCWDYRFLFLLIFSTLLDYFTGIKIAESKNLKIKRVWFWLSIVVNLGFLGVFKYYNFFAENFQQALSHAGIKVNPYTLKVILPVGISFYTFHGLSYILDLYKDTIKPVKNFVDYALFVSFFPLLVAGPIERATHLLPQLQKDRNFHYSTATDGCRQILWGLFKKIVIADNCATISNNIFENYEAYNGSTLVLGATFFAVQIYCDFSGYSDIALGTARLFGINLLRNFAYPYFSRDIAEFWRRWHTSLSSWFRDYLYIPLGGNKGSNLIKTRNVLIVFFASGFWHGANWTFIVWGFLNALFVMPSIIFKTNRKNLNTVAEGKLLPSGKEILSIILTFGLTVLAWIFFRSESLAQAITYTSKIFSFSVFTHPDGKAFLGENITIFSLSFLILIFFLIEWIGREHKYAIEKIPKMLPRVIRWSFYYSIIWTLFYFQGQQQQFIYFQF